MSRSFILWLGAVFILNACVSEAAPGKGIRMTPKEDRIRIAESMKLKNHPGHVVNSEGERDDATWGKRAKWCDYYGPIDGKMVGIAMFDHPNNPRYPTWWHVRDYGLFAANPFGQHDFEKLENKSTGDFKIPAGKSATFKYRFLLHRGNEKEAKVEQQYGQYIKASKR